MYMDASFKLSVYLMGHHGDMTTSTQDEAQRGLSSCQNKGKPKKTPH